MCGPGFVAPTLSARPSVRPGGGGARIRSPSRSAAPIILSRRPTCPTAPNPSGARGCHVYISAFFSAVPVTETASGTCQDRALIRPQRALPTGATFFRRALTPRARLQMWQLAWRAAQSDRPGGAGSPWWISGGFLVDFIPGPPRWPPGVWVDFMVKNLVDFWWIF